MNVGKSIRHFLELNDITQEELGAAMYVTQQRISVLCHKNSCGMRTAERLAKAFGVDVYDFLKAGEE